MYHHPQPQLWRSTKQRASAGCLRHEERVTHFDFDDLNFPSELEYFVFDLADREGIG